MAAKQLAGKVATVFNGNGFIANYIISRFGSQGASVVIGYRGSGYDESKMRVAGGLGQIHFAHYNLKDEDSLYNAIQHSDIVVNCIGKFNETSNFSFEDVHIEGPRRMARIARECGVKKFIHFSCLNANPDPKPVVLSKGSRFLKTKYFGELAVLEEFPDATIIRPADVFGSRDNFTNHFTEFRRTFFSSRLPIWDYYYEVEKQPLYVIDLVNGVMKCLEDESTNGKIIQAAGPYRYNFYDLIEYIRSCSGMSQKYDNYQISNLRYHIPLRLWLIISNKIQKYPFLTWERIEWDSTSDYIDPKLPTLESLGVKLTPIEPEIKRLCFYKPRFHRYEIPYEAQQVIDLPERLAISS